MSNTSLYSELKMPTSQSSHMTVFSGDYTTCLLIERTPLQIDSDKVTQMIKAEVSLQVLGEPS